MKKTMIRWMTATALFLTGLNLHAQGRPGGMGMGGMMKPEMNAALQQLFGKNTAFHGQAEMKLTQPGGKVVTMSLTLSALDGKMRADIDMSAVKGAELPPQALAQMKQMGMDKMVSVTRPDLETMYLIYPNMKSYVTLSLPKAPTEAAAKDAKLEKTEIGKETVESHPCVKNKVIITDGEGKKHEVTVWNATDLKDFPIKLAMKESGSDVEMLFKNVKLTSPDAKDFEPPTGFEKFGDFQQMMMQKIMNAPRPGGAPSE